jgi:hypothetical protein
VDAVIGNLLSPVIPSAVGESTDSRRAGEPSAQVLPPGLPLASMRRHRSDVADFSLRPIDTHGRVMDRRLVTSMGWQPGDQLQWRIDASLVVLSRGDGGTVTITRNGHLRLPAKLRHAAGAQIGERILLVAPVTRGLLVIVPLHMLDEMVIAHISDAVGGGLS